MTAWPFTAVHHRVPTRPGGEPGLQDPQHLTGLRRTPDPAPWLVPALIHSRAGHRTKADADIETARLQAVTTNIEPGDVGEALDITGRSTVRRIGLADSRLHAIFNVVSHPHVHGAVDVL